MLAAIKALHVAAMETGGYPASMRQAFMAVAYKGKHDDDPMCMDDYRPIMYMAALMKVLGNIIQQKLPDHAIRFGNSGATQCGFLPRRDRYQAVEDTIARIAEAGLEGLIILFIDLKGAFDRVHWSIIRLTLKKLGVSATQSEAVLSRMRAEVRVFHRPSGAKSGPFDRTSGVLQGGPVSPLLFTVANHPATLMISISIDKADVDIPPLVSGAPPPNNAEDALVSYADDERAIVQDKRGAAIATVAAQLNHELSGGKLGYRKPMNGKGSKTAILATGRAFNSFGLTEDQVRAGATAISIEDQKQALEELNEKGLNPAQLTPDFEDIPMVLSYDYLGVLMSTKPVKVNHADGSQETLRLLDLMPHVHRRCAMAETSIKKISNAAINSDWSTEQFSTILFQAVVGTALDGIHVVAACTDPPEVRRPEAYKD